jgi:hypothetical protein
MRSCANRAIAPCTRRQLRRQCDGAPYPAGQVKSTRPGWGTPAAAAAALTCAPRDSFELRAAMPERCDSAAASVRFQQRGGPRPRAPASLLSSGPGTDVARVSLFVSGECEVPPRLQDRRSEQTRSHLAYARTVCRGSLRPPSPGCRLAWRSGHLTADGARTAPNRPNRRCRSARRRRPLEQRQTQRWLDSETRVQAAASTR